MMSKNDASVSKDQISTDNTVDARPVTQRPVTQNPSADTIRVRKVNPTLLTRDDGASFARGEVDATPAEFERWSRLRLVVKV
jgi:hypothetical protein